jgi:hypothetical protein
MTKINSQTPTIPAFACVAQAGYTWTERESHGLHGAVALPKNRKRSQATINSPSDAIPTARMVRAHELLHARFTPAVMPMLRKAAKMGISPKAMQITEDIRIAQLGFDVGVWGEGVYIERAMLQKMDSALGAASDKKRLVYYFLANFSQPLEGKSGDVVRIYDLADLLHLADTMPEAEVYDAAKPICDEFAQRYRAIYARPRRGKRAKLQLFVELGRAVEKAMRDAAGIEPPKPKPPVLVEEDIEAAMDKGELEDFSIPEDEQDEGQDESDDAPSVPAPKGKSGKSGKSKKASQDDEDEDADDGIDLGEGPSPLGKKDEEGEIKKAMMERYIEEQRKRQREEDERRQREGKAPEISVGDLSKVNPADIDLASSVLQFGGHYDLDPGAGWAETILALAPLQRHFRCTVPRNGRASLDGSLPRHMQRWAIDRAILDSRGRKPGGTLLIDVSGSMNWARERTIDLIENCPALTVAIYSSCQISAQKFEVPTKGRLTIIARQGRVVAKDWDQQEHGQHGSHNICDGPALSWLARQPGPRVWFCDGMVSGHYPDASGEWFNLRVFKDAYRLAVLGQVTRTTSLEVVRDIFLGRRRPNPVREIPHLAGASENNYLLAEGSSAIGHSRARAAVKTTGTT